MYSLPGRFKYGPISRWVLFILKLTLSMRTLFKIINSSIYLYLFHIDPYQNNLNVTFKVLSVTETLCFLAFIDVYFRDFYE